MNYEFHPEALSELEDAARYYAKVQQGLEQRFIASVETAIQKLVAQPSAYGILEQDIRRCLTRVFPYALLYSIEPDTVLIVAVMHCRRKPGYWRSRIAPQET
jgi:toxin ParE1/3/4